MEPSGIGTFSPNEATRRPAAYSPCLTLGKAAVQNGGGAMLLGLRLLHRSTAAGTHQPGFQVAQEWTDRPSLGYHGAWILASAEITRGQAQNRPDCCLPAGTQPIPPFGSM